MKRYIYLLFVFHERIHEILSHEYPGDQGDWLPCSRENPLSTLCVLLVSNFPGILPAKTLPCSVYFGNQGNRLPCSLPGFSTKMGGSLAVVRSYALGCEPLVTGNLVMGLTIHSSHKQELSSVYQFIDVLYSLCIYEALRHLSLSSLFSLSLCSLHCTCAGLYILN